VYHPIASKTSLHHVVVVIIIIISSCCPILKVTIYMAVYISLPFLCPTFSLAVKLLRIMILPEAY
jgi:hypothetical protein